MGKSYTYKDAGVDIEKAEKALRRIKHKILQTNTPEVISGVGLFGGFYQFPARNFEKPVLVASTDGVGTKLKIAFLANRHDTIGQDLVNHCINDIAVCGARP
ncbi:MAG: AIR synthase related protein, partial [bacterium]